MNLLFKSGSEIVGYQIDRNNRKVRISSSKTNYRFVEVPFTHLFDPGREKEQDDYCKTLDDEQFKGAIIAKMMELGYSLEKC